MTTDTNSGQRASSGNQDDRSIGELLVELSEQLSRLVRAEMRLAVTELRRKAKRARRGGGLLGVAGVLGLLGTATLMACAVLALALVLPAWLAALLAGSAAMVLAALTALVARFQLRRATPPLPLWAAASLKDDIEIIRRGANR